MSLFAFSSKLLLVRSSAILLTRPWLVELEGDLLRTCCARAVVPVKGNHAVAQFWRDPAMSVMLSAPLFTGGYVLPPVFNISL